MVCGHNKMPKQLTSMTLDEVEADDPRRTKAYGSSAAGAPQFAHDTLAKPGTLLDIESEIGLTGKEASTPDLQDRIACHLLKRCGFAKFMARTLSLSAFGWSRPAGGGIHRNGQLHRSQLPHEAPARPGNAYLP